MPMTATRVRGTAPERVASTGVSGAGRAGAEAAPASGRGGRRVPEATVLVPILPQDLVDLAPVDDLALEQRLGHLVQHLDVAAEEELRPLIRFEHDAAHLVVDLHGRGLGVLRALREIAPQEDLLLLLAEGDRAELLAHAPLAHHLPRQLGGALKVVARAGGHVAEHELLGGTAAEQDGEVHQEEVLRVRVTVVERDLLGQAEGHAARDDRHLVHRIGAGEELCHQRVSRLVVGGVPPLLEADDHRLPLRPHHHLVLRHLEVGHVDLVLVLAGGEEGGLVDEVLEVRAGEAGGLAGKHLDVHVLGDRHPTGVQAALAPAALHVRRRHDDGPSEAARRESAGSSTSGRLVAAIRMTPSLVSKPSISTRSWLSVCSRSSCPPPRPAPRWRPTASISSMKMMQGAFFFPCTTRSRTAEAPTPTNNSTKSEPEIEKKGTPASPAMARARSVFPVPGAPTRRTPFGIRPPSLVNFFGSFRKAMISSSSSLASSMPATSLKVTLCVFSE